MQEQIGSLFGDARLFEIVLCLGVIWVLHWIDLMK